MASSSDPGALTEKLGRTLRGSRTHIKKMDGRRLFKLRGCLAGFFKQRKFSADDVTKRSPHCPDEQYVSTATCPISACRYVEICSSIRRSPSLPCMTRVERSSVLRQRAKVDVLADPPSDARRPRRESDCRADVTDGTHCPIGFVMLRHRTTR